MNNFLRGITLFLALVGGFYLWEQEANTALVPAEFSYQGIVLGTTREMITDKLGSPKSSRQVSQRLVLEAPYEPAVHFGFDRQFCVLMEAPKMDVHDANGVVGIQSPMSPDDVRQVLGKPSYSEEILRGRVDVYKFPNIDRKLSVEFRFLKRSTLFGLPLSGAYEARAFRVTALTTEELTGSVPF